MANFIVYIRTTHYTSYAIKADTWQEAKEHFDGGIPGDADELFLEDSYDIDGGEVSLVQEEVYDDKSDWPNVVIRYDLEAEVGE